MKTLYYFLRLNFSLERTGQINSWQSCPSALCVRCLWSFTLTWKWNLAPGERTKPVGCIFIVEPWHFLTFLAAKIIQIFVWRFLRAPFDLTGKFSCSKLSTFNTNCIFWQICRILRCIKFSNKYNSDLFKSLKFESNSITINVVKAFLNWYWRNKW